MTGPVTASSPGRPRSTHPPVGTLPLWAAGGPLQPHHPSFYLYLPHKMEEVHFFHYVTGDILRFDKFLTKS